MKTFGDRVHAFRVIWRSDSGLARAWDEIVTQRHLCDQIVSQTAHLQMFVSCISGVFTHPISAGRGTVMKPVYPSVSYWAVLDEATTDTYADLSLRLWTACPSAQVKHIMTTATWHEDEALGADCGTLFVTLKDHNSRYVYQRISRSLLAAGLDADFTSQPPNAKLAVVSHSKYMKQLPTSVDTLKAAGLCIYLDVLGIKLEGSNCVGGFEKMPLLSTGSLDLFH